MNEPQGPIEKRHRIFGFFRAPETAAMWLILVFLTFFYLWSRLDPEAEGPEIPSGPLQVEATLETLETGFQVQVLVDRPAFVALFLLEASGRRSRLFPRLGAPTNMPWPLVAGSTQVLPGDQESFSLALTLADRLEVIVRTDRVPETFDDLSDDDTISTRRQLQRRPE